MIDVILNKEMSPNGTVLLIITLWILEGRDRNIYLERFKSVL